MTLEEVNEYIIRKTISGPKRFRPKTREEIELRVIELEKQIKELKSAPSSPKATRDIPVQTRSKTKATQDAKATTPAPSMKRF